MKRIILLTATICFLSIHALAQQFEYGNPSELKGRTTYTVFTGDKLDAHDAIVEIISKQLPQLKLVDSVERSNIVLTFRSMIPDMDHTRRMYGEGLVTIPATGQDKSVPRLVLRFSNQNKAVFAAKPYEKFANEFVKAYKNANGLK